MSIEWDMREKLSGLQMEKYDFNRIHVRPSNKIILIQYLQYI
jgi:hypothetical protein